MVRCKRRLRRGLPWLLGLAVWLVAPPLRAREDAGASGQACGPLLALLAQASSAGGCGPGRLSRSAVEQRIDQACRDAAGLGAMATAAVVRLREVALRQGCASDADAAGHALCLLHPPTQQDVLERRLDRIRWGGYWRDPDDTAQCLLGLMRIGAAAAAAVDARLADRSFGRDALARLVALATDEERERLAPLLRALGGDLPGLATAAGRDDLHRGLCVAHAPSSPSLESACEEVGPELDPDWRSAVRAAEARAAQPRLARRLLVTGGILGASGALMAAAAAWRTTDALQFSAVGGGVVTGAALGLDAGLIVGALCSRDATSCAYEMIGTALLAAPLLAVGGGVGSYYASREPGWARVTTVGAEIAVVVPHLLYWNWAF